MQDRIDDRRSQFKKGIGDGSDRKWRDDVITQIKKEKRMETLNKKRGMLPEDAPQAGDHGGVPKGAAKKDWTLNDIELAVTEMRDGDYEKRYLALEKLRRLLSHLHDPPTEEVVKFGAVPILVDFLMQDSDSKLKFDAAWALTNICAGKSECTMAVVNCGAMPYFVQLLDSDYQELKEQSLWCLGNMAGDSPRVRDLIIEQGVVGKIRDILFEEMRYSGTGDHALGREGFLQNISWTLSNLCRGKPCPPIEVSRLIISLVHKLIYLPNPHIQADCCWSLSYLTDAAPVHPNPSDPSQISRENCFKVRINEVLFHGCGFKLTELLTSPYPLVVSPALRCVGNVLSGTDDQTQTMILCGVIRYLGELIKSPEPLLQKEAMWAFSNILAGNRSQIQEVIHSGVIPDIIKILTNGTYDVKRESAWALSNALVGGNVQQISMMLEYGVLPPMVDTLAYNDEKHALIILDAMGAILKAGKAEMQHSHMDDNPFVPMFEQTGGYSVSGVDRLEHLSGLPIHSKVRQRACQLIETYFELDESEDIDGGGAQTGAGLGDGAGEWAF